MAINLTIFPTEAEADVFLADGSQIPVAPQKESFIQIPNGSYCTIISTAANIESGEHPPTGEAFAEAMIAFWQGLADKMREAAQPEVNPL